jgi:multidrug efflux pump subunit AcrB
MTAVFMYVGYGYPLRLGVVEIEPGFRLGNYRMMFEVDNAFRSELDESEFTTAIQARGQIALGSKASVHVEASRMTVYTYNRLYYTYLGAGVSYRMQSGARQQEALRQ